MEKVKLREVAKLQGGYAFKSDEFVKGGTPVIKIGNIMDGEILIDDKITLKNEEFLRNHPEFIVEKNDILIAMSGATVGKIGRYMNEKVSLLNQRVGKFIVNNVLKDYLYYILQSDLFKEYVLSNAFGCAQPNISGSQIEEFEFCVYDIETQKSIVEILHRITIMIDKRKKQLEKLDELIKARFVELFGDPVINPKSWETAPLSALILNANNGMARRGKDADGSIVLRLVELQNGFIDYSAPNRICLNETEKKRYELVDNDFLFARVNGNPDYVGRCAVFKGIGEPVFHNDHIIRVHFDETKLNGCFTSVLLNSDYGKRQMREQIKTSAGQYTISQDGIGAIMTILPPMELQNQFAAFVEQTDKSKLEVQKSLEKLELLKKALMQKYFG